MRLTDRAITLLAILSFWVIILGALAIGQSWKNARMDSESGLIPPLTCTRGEGCS